MICPRCNSNQTDDVKFCTVCGANLLAVRQALDVRERAKTLTGARRGSLKCSCRTQNRNGGVRRSKSLVA
jgi:hypothetical protein